MVEGVDDLFTKYKLMRTVNEGPILEHPARSCEDEEQNQAAKGVVL